MRGVCDAGCGLHRGNVGAIRYLLRHDQGIIRSAVGAWVVEELGQLRDGADAAARAAAPAAHRLVEKLGEVINTMHDTQENTRRFVRERPDLVPVLHAMIDLARENEAQPTSRLGEFCRNWLAAREPSTPRALRPFVDAGLIQGSPRGTGNGRTFYVLTDRAAIEHVLASGSN